MSPPLVARLASALTCGSPAREPSQQEHLAIATTTVIERTSEAPHLRVVPRLRELWGYREILANLVRKELKVKYTASFLGAIWSVLNPIVFLAVFSFVAIVLDNRVPDFPVFLLSGLLAWNLFSASLLSGSSAVIDNANLVKKVAFPREILPLASVGVALFDFALQTTVLLAFIVVSGHGIGAEALVLYPMAFATLMVFTTAITLWSAALNVRYRDVGHLLNLGLLVWFWMTPIVYQAALVQQTLVERDVAGVSLWNLYLVNPLAPIVLGFQRALYGDPVQDGMQVLPELSVAWQAGLLALALAVSAGFLLLAWRMFFRRSGDFAEEL
ncbi:MAG: ABC transporter permease [Actinomycetota bacterium]|nr:ABC transporter permease [Actinomycetota bacterium]